MPTRPISGHSAGITPKYTMPQPPWPAGPPHRPCTLRHGPCQPQPLHNNWAPPRGKAYIWRLSASSLSFSGRQRTATRTLSAPFAAMPRPLPPLEREGEDAAKRRRKRERRNLSPSVTVGERNGAQWRLVYSKGRLDGGEAWFIACCLR